jgi:hypothetical protein
MQTYAEAQEKFTSKLPRCEDMNSCKHNCWGKQSGQNGLTIEGEYKDNILHGQVYAEGINDSWGPRTFSGVFIWGRFGFGTLVSDKESHNKLNYTGQTIWFEADGMGVADFSDGSRYAGGWNKFKFDKLGIWTKADGSVQSGTWKKGDFWQANSLRSENDIRSELTKIEKQIAQNLERTRKQRTLTCPDPESTEIRKLFNELADLTDTWRNSAYSARAAGAAGSSSLGALLQEKAQLESKRMQLTKNFVALWAGKANTFKTKYVEKNEKYTEVLPSGHPFLNGGPSIWMELDKGGEILSIMAPPIGTPSGDDQRLVQLYKR